MINLKITHHTQNVKLDINGWSDNNSLTDETINLINIKFLYDKLKDNSDKKWTLNLF